MRILLTLCPFLFAVTCLAQTEIDPKLTEVWQPEPKVVAPGRTATDPPSDAIVLLGPGRGLEAFTSDSGKPARWDFTPEGVATVMNGGNLFTRKSFGSMQIHLEWRSPEKVEGEGQGRGNSGLFLQDRYEVQILDSYNNRTYSNGQAGSLYKQRIPLANASRLPGQWQTYDIVYHSPKFGKDGKVERKATVTLIHNGILVQDHAELDGPTVYRGKPQYQAHGAGPLRLQNHGNPVSFRNFWVREIGE